MIRRFCIKADHRGISDGWYPVSFLSTSYSIRMTVWLWLFLVRCKAEFCLECIIHTDDRKMIIHFERNEIEVDTFFMKCLRIYRNRVYMRCMRLDFTAIWEVEWFCFFKADHLETRSVKLNILSIYKHLCRLKKSSV